MSAPSKPWMKFYPQDWRADEKLRLCSLAARGLWIEMLAIMHRSERYGQLLIGGRVPTDAQLAVQVGASPSEVTTLLDELGGADVFSRAASGAIYSRRMTRDAKRAETARKNGKSGGNPNLRKQSENSGSDNRQDKGSDKGGVKPQRPEAREPSSNDDGRPEPPNLRERLWSDGLAFVIASGQPEPKARSLLGKWRKDAIALLGKADGEAKVISLLAEAQRETVTDLVPWMEAALKPNGQRRRPMAQGDPDDYLDLVLREEAARKAKEGVH